MKSRKLFIILLEDQKCMYETFINRDSKIEQFYLGFFPLQFKIV